MSETLENEAIRALLPHRYPMLLVDKIVELEPGTRAVGLKNVTINEPFFQGHFPGMAVMPGVLILEAMAQVAGIMMLTVPQYAGRIPMIASVENARFYRPVVPGDVLRLVSETIWVRGMIGKVALTAHVGDTVVTKSEMKFALKDPLPPPNLQLERLGITITNNGSVRSSGQAKPVSEHSSAGGETQQDRENHHRG